MAVEEFPVNPDERRQYVQDLLDSRVPFGAESEFNRRVSVELWSRILSRKARHAIRRRSKQLVEYVSLTVVAYDAVLSPGDVRRGMSSILVLQPILYIDNRNLLYRINGSGEVLRVFDLATLTSGEISRLKTCAEGNDKKVRQIIPDIFDTLSLDD